MTILKELSYLKETNFLKVKNNLKKKLMNISLVAIIIVFIVLLIGIITGCNDIFSNIFKTPYSYFIYSICIIYNIVLGKLFFKYLKYCDDIIIENK
jgi:uncharacterized protein YacL